jgi:phospholipid/cholesterol/gamma-HCH transport system substrate-binding protein
MTAIKVGLFATLGLIVMALFIWNIEDINPFGPEGQRLAAVFDSVAGLDDKASVRIAGVRVGKVDGVGLQGNRAKVSLLLDKPLPLTVGTFAKIANLGLLGEKYVELVPGPAGAPLLPKDAVLPGQTPVSFDDAMAKLDKIGDSIQQVTGSLAGPAGGVGPLIQSLQMASDQIRLLVMENRANVASTVRNFDAASATLARELPRIAAQMNRALDQIAGLVAENRGDVSASLGNIKELTSKLQTSVDNLNKITGKVASGEGTVGKLINSEEGYNEVIKTLDSIQGGVETLSSTLGAVQKFKLDLDLQTYYLAEPEKSQSSFALVIDPQDGHRLYKAGFSNTAFGEERVKTQQITTTNPDGTTEVETIETLTTETSKQLTGLFGYKNSRDLRLWAGLIENSGGAQVEVPFLDRKLWVSFEAFDFNRPQDLSPHLRVSTRWQFHPNLYLVGGYDDPLESQRESIFFGGGIRWNDDNLKYLLGSVPLK